MSKYFKPRYVILLFLLTFSGVFLGYITSDIKREKRTATIPVLPRMTSAEILSDVISHQNSTTVKYVLKEHNGFLGIFKISSDGAERLHEYLDIPFGSLPASDREILADGIESSSISEILQIIEDFSV